MALEITPVHFTPPSQTPEWDDRSPLPVGWGDPPPPPEIPFPDSLEHPSFPLPMNSRCVRPLTRSDSVLPIEPPYWSTPIEGATVLTTLLPCAPFITKPGDEMVDSEERITNTALFPSFDQLMPDPSPRSDVGSVTLSTGTAETTPFSLERGKRDRETGMFPEAEGKRHHTRSSTKERSIKKDTTGVSVKRPIVARKKPSAFHSIPRIQDRIVYQREKPSLGESFQPTDLPSPQAGPSREPSQRTLWTKKEIDTLRTTSLSATELFKSGVLPGRSESSIRSQMVKLDLDCRRGPHAFWSPSEDRVIREYHSYGPAYIQEKLLSGKTVDAVAKRIKKLVDDRGLSGWTRMEESMILGSIQLYGADAYAFIMANHLLPRRNPQEIIRKIHALNYWGKKH